MKFLKKLTALVMSAVLAVSCMTAVSSAAAITTIKSGQTVTETLATNTMVGYYIEIANSGELTIDLSFTSNYIGTLLMGEAADGSAIMLKPTQINASTGKDILVESNEGTGAALINDSAKKVAGTVKFSVSKGKYMIMFSNSNSSVAYNGSGKLTFTAKVGKKSAEIKGMSITIKKGTSIQLGTILTDSSASGVKWSTSKKAVATVSSKGKVTAKKKGSAVITAKLGSTKVEITVIVE